MDPFQNFFARLENIELPVDVKDGFVSMMRALQELGDIDGFTKVDIAAIENEKACGDAEECGNDFLYAVFDQREIHSRHRKWYTTNTVLGDRTGNSRLTKKTGLGFHHSAVFNGFGAWATQVQHYKELAEESDWVETASGLIMPGSNAFSSHWLVHPNRDITVSEWARAQALGDRYRGFPEKDWNQGVPYHAIFGPNSVLYLNLPFDWVTWHGNSLNNDFLGVAWDANSVKQAIEAGLAKDLIFDGERLIDLARSEGHPIKFFDVHATRTNKPSDPGAEFIREIMMPLAKKTGCEILMDKAQNGGKTINSILAA